MWSSATVRTASYTYSLLFPSLHMELSYSTYSILYLFTVIPLAPHGAQLQYVQHLILIHCYSPCSTWSSATVRTASYTYSLLFPPLHMELSYSTYQHLVLIHCYSPRSIWSSATVRTSILYLFTVIPLAPYGAQLQYVPASCTYSLLFPLLHVELSYSTYQHLVLIHCYSPCSTWSSATVRTNILYLFTVIPLAPHGAQLQYVLASYTYSLLFPSLHMELSYSTYQHLILIH